MRPNRRLTLRGWLLGGTLAGLMLTTPWGPALARAQAPASKDEALEKLLEKLEGPKAAPKADAPKSDDNGKRPDPRPDSKPAPDPGKKDDPLEKLLEKLEGPKSTPAPDAPKADPGKPGETPKPATPPSGEVAGKDQSLDDLLKGLGQTEDKPTSEGKKPPTPGSGSDDNKPDQPPPPGGSNAPDEGKDKDKTEQQRALDRTEQNLDQRLEELTGRKPKKQGSDKKRQQGQGQGEGGGQGQGQGEGENEGEDKGPLGDLVKQMRDVEERLSQPDTGDETRKKQTEIVRKLDTMLEQARNGSGSTRSMMAKGSGKPGGKQPGQGDQAGAEGVGASKPLAPRNPPVPVETVKAIWGQLPSLSRDDINNVLKESPLPNREDMIRLYYLSLSKKSTTGGN